MDLISYIVKTIYSPFFQNIDQTEFYLIVNDNGYYENIFCFSASIEYYVSSKSHVNKAIFLFSTHVSRSSLYKLPEIF